MSEDDQVADRMARALLDRYRQELENLITRLRSTADALARLGEALNDDHALADDGAMTPATDHVTNVLDTLHRGQAALNTKHVVKLAAEYDAVLREANLTGSPLSPGPSVSPRTRTQPPRRGTQKSPPTRPGPDLSI